MTVVQRGLCIAPDDATLEPTPTWVSLYDYESSGLRVQRVQIDGGRQDEISKMQTVTLVATLFDSGGVLDTTNPSSPFVGKLNPRKQVAFFLTNPLTNVEFGRFRGFLENIQTTVDVTERFMHHTLTASGILTILATTEAIPGAAGTTPPAGSEGNVFYDSGPVQDRILAALADAGIPSEMATINSGNVQVQASVYPPREDILAIIAEAADAEFPGLGNVFEDTLGQARFNGRYARFNPADASYHISRWKAGDFAACEDDTNAHRAPISSLTFDRNVANVLNAVLATPKGIAAADIAGQLETDPTSIGAYGVISTAFENLRTLQGDEMSPLDANAETFQFAEYYVNNYKDPRTRINQLGFKTTRQGHPFVAAWWRFICGFDLNDLVDVVTSNPGGGGFSDDFFIEGRHETYTPMRNEFPQIAVTLDVTPRAYFTNTYPDGPT